ncbi:MAG: hypothetical protein V1858_00930 [Candidatus Gottesmanbacteria bacterium]
MANILENIYNSLRVYWEPDSCQPASLTPEELEARLKNLKPTGLCVELQKYKMGISKLLDEKVSNDAK